MVDTGVYREHVEFQQGGGSTASRVEQGYAAEEVAQFADHGQDCTGCVAKPFAKAFEPHAFKAFRDGMFCLSTLPFSHAVSCSHEHPRPYLTFPLSGVILIAIPLLSMSFAPSLSPEAWSAPVVPLARQARHSLRRRCRGAGVRRCQRSNNHPGAGDRLQGKRHSGRDPGWAVMGEKQPSAAGSHFHVPRSTGQRDDGRGCP